MCKVIVNETQIALHVRIRPSAALVSSPNAVVAILIVLVLSILMCPLVAGGRVLPAGVEGSSSGGVTKENVQFSKLHRNNFGQWLCSARQECVLPARGGGNEHLKLIPRKKAEKELIAQTKVQAAAAAATKPPAARRGKGLEKVTEKPKERAQGGKDGACRSAASQFPLQLWLNRSLLGSLVLLPLCATASADRTQKKPRLADRNGGGQSSVAAAGKESDDDDDCVGNEDGEQWTGTPLAFSLLSELARTRITLIYYIRTIGTPRRWRAGG